MFSDTGKLSSETGPHPIEINSERAIYFDDTQSVSKWTEEDGVVWTVEPNTTNDIQNIDFNANSKTVGVAMDDGATASLHDGTYNVETPLSGTVTDQSGAPVSGATVEGVAVNKDALTPTSAEQTLEERAEELLKELHNPAPDAWNPDLSVRDKIRSTDGGKVVAVHSKEDWAMEKWSTSPDVSSPVIFLDPGQTYVLSLWSGTDSFVEDGIDEGLPGKTTDGAVKIMKLGPGGSEIDSYTVHTDDTYATGATPLGLVAKRHHIAQASFEAGFYRVEPETGGVPYVIVVGNERELIGQFADQLEDRRGDLSERASEIAQYRADDKIQTYRVTTDSEGQFSMDVGSSYTDVALTARQCGDLMNSVDPANQSLQTYIDEARQTDYNGSCYFSTGATTVQPPASDVTVGVVGFDGLGFSDIGEYQDFIQNLRENLLNRSMEGVEQVSDLEDWSPEDLDEYREQASNILANSDSELVQSWRERAEEVGVNPDLSVDLAGADESERQKVFEAWLAEQAADNTPSESPFTDYSDDEDGTTASVTIPFDGELDEEATSLLIRHSNGSTSLLNESQWSVDSRLGRGDAIVIDDYEMDDAAEKVEVVGANEDGEVTRGSAILRNPNVATRAPGLDSVSLNTLSPGAGQTVKMDVLSDDPNFRSVNSAEVIGPYGSVVESNVSGNSVTFDAVGEGVHRAQVTVSDSSGNDYTEVITVGALADDKPDVPTVRVREGVLGTYVLAGDGVVTGQYQQSSSGDTVAVVLRDGENPSAVHVHVEDLSSSSDAVTVRLLDGANERAFGKHVTTRVYVDSLNENAHVYRNGKPVSIEDSPAGIRYDKSSATVIETYTDGAGTVDISVNNNPGIIDRIVWTYKTAVESRMPSIPVLTIQTPATAGWF